MIAADYLVDIGPKAGFHGGRIVAQGKPACLIEIRHTSITSMDTQDSLPGERRKGNGKSLELKGAKGNNLKNVDVRFPLGKFTVVTGVSGSGKSTLINETLYPILSHHAYGSKGMPMEYKY